MTFYLGISSLGAPHNLGVDDTRRTVYEANFIAEKVDSGTTPEELYGLLVSGGAFASGRVFVDSLATIPVDQDVDNPKTYLSVLIHEGPGPRYIHNERRPKYQRPLIQLLVRSRRAVDARAAMQTAYSILSDVRNVDVAPVTII